MYVQLMFVQLLFMCGCGPLAIMCSQSVGTLSFPRWVLSRAWFSRCCVLQSLGLCLILLSVLHQLLVLSPEEAKLPKQANNQSQ